MTALSDDIGRPAHDPAGELALTPVLVARIAVAGGATRAEIVRDCQQLVSHRLSPAEWRAAAASAADELVVCGLSTESRGRLKLTPAGEEMARRLLGTRGALPSNWGDMRDERLVAVALGLTAESATKLRSLATPEGLRALVLQKAFGLPLKGNQTANRLRVELAVVALERAFGNKIKGGLGASGGFTAKAGRLLAGQLSARPRDFGSDGRLIAELAAEQAGAPQPDADAVRLALLRRWVTSLLPRPAAPQGRAADVVALPVRAQPMREARGDAPPVAANDPGPCVARPVPRQRPGLEDFAREVQSSAAQVAEGWPGNRKAFISRVWQAIRASWPEWQLSEIEFKCMLAEAHRAGQVVLANADLKALNIPKADLSRLWTVTQDEILAAVPGAVAGSGQFRPVINSPSFPTHPFDPAAPGMSANVPMIVGSNRTEASVFMGGDPKIVNLTEADLTTQVSALVPAGEAADTIAMYRRIYPKARNDEILYMTSTDRGYFLDSTILAGRKADQNAAPVWMYQFYRETPLEGGRYHVPHASEIPFVFDTLDKAKSIGGGPTAGAD